MHSAFPCLLLSAIASLFVPEAAPAESPPPLTGKEVTAKLELLRTGDTPNIYGAIYYPKWNQALDGLRSITAEAVAEHANEVMKAGKVRFEVLSEPIILERTATLRLRRIAPGGSTAIVPAYLHLSENSKSWDLLVLPIPYKAPGGLPRKDRQFMQEALNAEHGFESKLYEFDAATLSNFQALKSSNAKADAAAVEIGEMVLAVQRALAVPGDPASLETIARFGTDSRYYTMIRGWLSLELRGTESQLGSAKNKPSEELTEKAAFLKKAIRRIDLE